MRVGSQPFVLPPPPPERGSAAGPAGFTDKRAGAIDAVAASQHKADGALAGVASGGETDLHTMMISLEEADIAMRTLVSVRDKMVEGYQQIMNMSI